jgi:hypothetical protein
MGRRRPGEWRGCVHRRNWRLKNSSSASPQLKITTRATKSRCLNRSGAPGCLEC